MFTSSRPFFTVTPAGTRALLRFCALQEEEKVPDFTQISPSLHFVFSDMDIQPTEGQASRLRAKLQSKGNIFECSPPIPSCFCPYPPWLSPHPMWAPFALAKPDNLHTKPNEAHGLKPFPLESQALLHCHQSPISKIL